VKNANKRVISVPDERGRKNQDSIKKAGKGHKGFTVEDA